MKENIEEYFHIGEVGSVANKIPVNKELRANIRKLILGIILVIVLIVAMIIIIFYKTSSNEETYSKDDIKGEIKCEYNIEITSSETRILGNDFSKESKFDIEINGEIIKYSKNYKFPDLGLQKVKFLLYDDINMENMFKDVIDLSSIIMNSDTNLKIKFINNAFEGCEKLTYFKISGFDLTEIKSMNKLFYKSGLESFNTDYLFTKNLIDISYMFAETSLSKIDLSLLDTSKVSDMSYLFENCYSLKEINIKELKTEKVKDMSHMFKDMKIYYL